MNSETIRKAGELCMSQKDNDLLEYLCTTIAQKVRERKPVYEKMIMDFSLLITRLIHDSMLFELPHVFEEMAEIVERYWFYSASREEDTDLSLSYVRIYQNINILKVYTANNKRENKIHDDAIKIGKQPKKVQAIRAIHDNPGSTHGDICEIMRTSKSNLSQCISSLIEQGYIIVNRMGKYNYYSLSNKGLELHELLCAQNKRNGVPLYWTKSHLKALSLLLRIAEEAGDTQSIIDTVTIKTLVEQLSRYDEEKIEEVLTEIRKTAKRMDENYEFDGLDSIRYYPQKKISMNEMLSPREIRRQMNECIIYFAKDNITSPAFLGRQEWLYDNRLMTKEMENVK